MAHIPDGILSAPVLAAGTLLAAGGTAFALRRLRESDLPATALLSSAFFVGSLIQVPLGPASGHLMLTGLMGLVLGWSAFPALLAALLLQFLFFGFGGVTTLGINTLNLALPAVALGLAFRGAAMRGPRAAAVAGGCAGAGAVLATGMLVAGSLWASGAAFLPAAKLVAAAHIPMAGVEAAVTAAAAGLLYRVRPQSFARAIPVNA